MLHYAYNRVIDGWTPKQIKDALKTQLNNVELMDTLMVACAQQQASGLNELIKSSDNPNRRIIFGGKKNYIRRCKGLISKEEYREKRISPLMSIGANLAFMPHFIITIFRHYMVNLHIFHLNLATTIGTMSIVLVIDYFSCLFGNHFHSSHSILIVVT